MKTAQCTLIAGAGPHTPNQELNTNTLSVQWWSVLTYLGLFPKTYIAIFKRTYTPFCIMAIAHSRWTLCEHGRIWQPLKASWKKRIDQPNKNIEIWIVICFSFVRFRLQKCKHLTSLTWQVNKTKCSARLIALAKRQNLLKDISYSTLLCKLSNYLQTDATLVVSWICSAGMSSFQPFVQTDVTHITVEGAVLVDTEQEIETSLCRYLLEHNMIRWGNKFRTHTDKRRIFTR